MKARKTIEVTQIKERANAYLSLSANEHKDIRKGHHDLATMLLMDAGAYKGFGYLRKEDVAPGLTYGIEWVDGKAVHHDQTRTFFY